MNKRMTRREIKSFKITCNGHVMDDWEIGNVGNSFQSIEKLEKHFTKCVKKDPTYQYGYVTFIEERWDFDMPLVFENKVDFLNTGGY